MINVLEDDEAYLFFTTLNTSGGVERHIRSIDKTFSLFFFEYRDFDHPKQHIEDPIIYNGKPHLGYIRSFSSRYLAEGDEESVVFSLSKTYELAMTFEPFIGRLFLSKIRPYGIYRKAISFVAG